MKRSTCLSPLLLPLAMMVTFVSALPALSQSTRDDELREIVVKAEKLPDNLELVPIAIAEILRHRENKLPERIVSAFLTSANVTLYSIEESETGRVNIHGYKVLGKAKLKKDETAAILADMQKSLTKENRRAMCFHPHHVLRAEIVGHTYDMVICYLCGLVDSYEIDYSPKGKYLSANSLDGSPDLMNGIAKKHGLAVPRVVIEEEIFQRETRRNDAQFSSAAPQSIRALFPQNINPRAYRSPDNRTMHEALAKQFPSTPQQILALFEWNGSLPWSGLSAYEDSVAGELLQAYAFADLLSEAQSDQLSTLQLAGAAKFFARSSIPEQDQQNRQALVDVLGNYAKDIDDWSKATPPAIRPLWKDEMWFYEGGFRLSASDDTLMQQALTQEIPDTNARILSLFGWYGSGLGVKRNSNGYENIVAKLLCDFTTPELGQALQTTRLTEQQLDGAARLFAHWEYKRDRKGEVKALPPALKATLLAHIEKSGNPFWEKYKGEFE